MVLPFAPSSVIDSKKPADRQHGKRNSQAGTTLLSGQESNSHIMTTRVKTTMLTLKSIA